MIKVIKGQEIKRETFNNITIAPEGMVPEEMRFIFKTGREPKISHISSKYNFKNYSTTDIGTSFDIMERDLIGMYEKVI